MDLFLRNKLQIEQAKSELNRYYFHLRYGREPIDDAELIMHYIDEGGSKDFANKLAKEECGI